MRLIVDMDTLEIISAIESKVLTAEAPLDVILSSFGFRFF